MKKINFNFNYESDSKNNSKSYKYIKWIVILSVFVLLGHKAGIYKIILKYGLLGISTETTPEYNFTSSVKDSVYFVKRINSEPN